ncbi:Z1 domain-containing protein [Intrasporangium sp. YIM S08009]|uniref:Z1 domain-containing protein n=1 Tax=Intrasporangium zincisolvens TaxID=3080018 RepID=UPI002B056213|nr:Z1 domain-containing protein [Intrasporangium sp. YIM S08009]
MLDQIEMLIRQGRSESEAAATLKVLLVGEQALVDSVVQFRHDIAEQRRNMGAQNAVFDPEDESGPWYVGPSAMDVFWPDLKAGLEGDPSWVEAVPSLDAASTDIVGLLADPHSPSIRTRGLVLGFVQSGKTANFTASIAKAADAGYRLFIVLSGVHNSLRRQTQLRIDEQLIERHPARWVALTDEHRDFGQPVKALPLLHAPDLRIIAVVKKNVSRLTRLRDWLREAHKHGGLDSCPVMIIDDEADQASPNAAKNPELDRTKINERLTELLALPRVAYVGYTATPFANVLVNPADATDIYPRSFVYSLPKPATYFGSRELFGQHISEEEASAADAPHDMIRIIPDDEAERHSTKTLLAEGPEVTDSLAEAIRWFVLATAARRVRSGVAKHSSMLIHTTMRVGPQLDYLDPISAHVKYLGTELAAGNSHLFRSLWEKEVAAEPARRHGLEPVTFEQLLPALPETISELKVLADNGLSTDRLVYNDEPATVIAVGGNTLSRGLTLEGLVSSFFLRSSNTYDTLLQMGRWFGYRPGYGDLPRIWTTQQLADDFEFLSDVEDSLRTEIARYRTMDGATPANLPVRIRLHPRMQATANQKMKYAIRGDASFSAQRPQTTYFTHRDAATIAQNLGAARKLLETAKAAGVHEDVQDSRVILRDIPVGLVSEFIRDYRFHEDSELRSDLLVKYIAGQVRAGALTAWNVAIMGIQQPKRALTLGLDSPSPLITRSKLKRTSTPSRAVIGTLMSKPDRVADLVPAASVGPRSTDAELQKLRDEDGRGLLVLYPIDKDSKPKAGVTDRVPLEASDDLLGVAVCFPTAAPGSEPENTIQVDLTEMQADDEVGSDAYEDTEGSRDDVDLEDE